MAYLGALSSGGPLMPMNEYLVGSDRFTGDLKPDMLATKWEMSPDGKVWRFNLRPGIRFHNGATFTAKDVAFSWELIAAKDARGTNTGRWRGLLKSKEDFEIVNDQEIAFRLTRPELELPFFLSDIQDFTIYSKDYWDKVGADGYRKSPVGTGPFRFKEFKEGQHILYERVENHWRKTPEFKELQMFYVPEDLTRLATLLAGETYISEIPRSSIPQAKEKGMKVERSTQPAFQVNTNFMGNYLPEKGLNPIEPLTNKLVRQAMNLAVNRKEINDNLFGGSGEVQVVLGFQNNDPAFNPAWKAYPYDPKKAKELLAQAGYPNGFETNISVTAFPGVPEMTQVSEALDLYFRAIGIKPKLVPLEFGTLREKYRKYDLHNTVVSFRQSATPLFYFLTIVVLSDDQGGVTHQWETPFIEERWKKFNQSIDRNERGQILREIGDHLYNEYANIPMLWLYGEVGVNPKVVADYKANMLVFGAARSHEFTEAASK